MYESSPSIAASTRASDRYGEAQEPGAQRPNTRPRACEAEIECHSETKEALERAHRSHIGRSRGKSSPGHRRTGKARRPEKSGPRPSRFVMTKPIAAPSRRHESAVGLPGADIGSDACQPAGRAEPEDERDEALFEPRPTP